jgi:hypothetical protein
LQKFTHINGLEKIMYNLEKCHLHHLQDHTMLHNFQGIIILIYFQKVIIHDGNRMCEKWQYYQFEKKGRVLE